MNQDQFNELFTKNYSKYYKAINNYITSRNLNKSNFVTEDIISEIYIYCNKNLNKITDENRLNSFVFNLANLWTKKNDWTKHKYNDNKLKPIDNYEKDNIYNLISDDEIDEDKYLIYKEIANKYYENLLKWYKITKNEELYIQSQIIKYLIFEVKADTINKLFDELNISSKTVYYRYITSIKRDLQFYYKQYLKKQN